MDISDAVCRDLGTFVSVLPEPDARRRWQRLDCPYCDGRQTAAVNYDAGWFECFREPCRKVVTAGSDKSAVTRFAAQIKQAARNIHGKYGRWIPESEGQEVAQMLVLGYDKGKPMGPNDSGKLPDWEMDVNGDPDQLDRYVLAALNGDLLNYAEAKVRKARNGETLLATGSDIEKYAEPAAPVLPAFSAEDYPTLYLRHVDKMTVKEIATELHLTTGQVQARIKREKAALKAAVTSH